MVYQSFFVECFFFWLHILELDFDIFCQQNFVDSEQLVPYMLQADCQHKSIGPIGIPIGSRLTRYVCDIWTVNLVAPYGVTDVG